MRLSAYDFVPYEADADGVGAPVADAPRVARYAFGGDASGIAGDLAEAHRFLDLCRELGIGLVCITAGSPYYNPHIQRPAFFPPSDGYTPPEDPLVGAARMIAATAELTHAHPDARVVGSGYSYLQQWLPNAAQHAVRTGGAASVGIGRGMLSYPHLPADVLAGRALRDAVAVPHVQRLHHRAAQRARVRLLPARRLLQGLSPNASSSPRSRRRRGSGHGR